MVCDEHLVYLGLGSNLGERAENLRRGLRLLQAGGVEIAALSGVYETAPWGGVEQPDFYNLVAAGRTQLAPPDLLRLAKETERAVGRRPGVRWGARVLDIDILLYDEIIYEELKIWPEGLIIPHKEMRCRAFVLAPLLEIAPDISLPGTGQGQTAAALLAALPEAEQQGVRRVGVLTECGIERSKENGID